MSPPPERAPPPRRRVLLAARDLEERLGVDDARVVAERVRHVPRGGHRNSSLFAGPSSPARPLARAEEDRFEFAAAGVERDEGPAAAREGTGKRRARRRLSRHSPSRLYLKGEAFESRTRWYVSHPRMIAMPVHGPLYSHSIVTLSLASVGLMYVAFMVVGWVASRRVRPGSVADLIVAGRQMPFWIAGLTMTATWVDGGYLLGTAEGAYKNSVQLGVQGGLCYGLSLILGGLFFAGVMRRFGFATLIDPFEARFGRHWAAVLALPALAAEVFWSAELLVAIGSTFGVLLGLDLTQAIVFSAIATTAYTVLGGMWSVAYTDMVQLGLVAIGLAAALPFVLAGSGGLDQAWTAYATARPSGAGLLPPLHAIPPLWTQASIVGWWDVSLMLVCGGVPWNCYFQRVLSCRTPGDARRQSVMAGALTMLFTLPPLLMGVAAASHPWSSDIAARLAASPADTMPMLFARAVPGSIGLLGLVAIVGAVTSSFSSSILSAGSMLGWNGIKRLLWPSLSLPHMVRVIRMAILILAALATVLALRVRSVQALWFFTSDLVFVLLFPQLLAALFDPRANRLGSIAALGVSAVLRFGAGEPLLGLPAFLPYDETVPVRLMAASAGLVLLPLVSRLTTRWDTPRLLQRPASDGV